MPASYLQREDVAFGRYLVVPRGYHLVLAGLLTVVSLLVLVSSWVFFKKSITFMVGYVALPLAVATGMWLQAVLRAQKKLVDPTSDAGTTWLFIDIGSDRLLGVVAMVGMIVTLVQAAILTAGLVNCGAWTAQGLAQIVFGADLNATAVTDWTTQYRTPFFATQILTYQMCLDDYALTIAYVAVAYGLVVLQLLVGIEQFLSRDQSRRLYRRIADYLKAERRGEEPPEGETRVEMAALWASPVGLGPSPGPTHTTRPPVISLELFG